MKQLPPAKCYFFEESYEREFRDEITPYEKGTYYGEWDPKQNKPHGFGYLIRNRKLYEGYFKDGKPDGVGRHYSIRHKKLYSVDEGMF